MWQHQGGPRPYKQIIHLGNRAIHTEETYRMHVRADMASHLAPTTSSSLLKNASVREKSNNTFKQGTPRSPSCKRIQPVTEPLHSPPATRLRSLPTTHFLSPPATPTCFYELEVHKNAHIVCRKKTIIVSGHYPASGILCRLI